MTRAVEHGEKDPGGRRCACGANFKTNRELRHHVEGKRPERVVWINTDAPISPRKERR